MAWFTCVVCFVIGIFVTNAEVFNPLSNYREGYDIIGDKHNGDVNEKLPFLKTSTSSKFRWKIVKEKSSVMSATGECPVIVSRSDWHAKPPVRRLNMTTPVPFVIIHHTDGNSCKTYEECCAIVRNIQDFHMIDRGWDDIGYTFLVGEDGNVYEGRGWDTIGAHCPWYNKQSIGISIMGDYMNRIPDKKAIDAVQAIIKCAIERGKLTADYTLYGHRQGRKGTECPGNDLFKEIQSWPHWKPGDHFPPTSNLATTRDIPI